MDSCVKSSERKVAASFTSRFRTSASAAFELRRSARAAARSAWICLCSFSISPCLEYKRSTSFARFAYTFCSSLPSLVRSEALSASDDCTIAWPTSFFSQDSRLLMTFLSSARKFASRSNLASRVMSASMFAKCAASTFACRAASCEEAQTRCSASATSSSRQNCCKRFSSSSTSDRKMSKRWLSLRTLVKFCQLAWRLRCHSPSSEVAAATSRCA
mmetsp:Transcript_140552/g.258718  ORF Transcript_140552/g.258718 Transcript_140552/m.258718 type:complete len:216 (-) Transcript_140552:203-850(-)